MGLVTIVFRRGDFINVGVVLNVKSTLSLIIFLATPYPDFRAHRAYTALGLRARGFGIKVEGLRFRARGFGILSTF